MRGSSAHCGGIWQALADAARDQSAGSAEGAAVAADAGQQEEDEEAGNSRGRSLSVWDVWVSQHRRGLPREQHLSIPVLAAQYRLLLQQERDELQRKADEANHAQEAGNADPLGTARMPKRRRRAGAAAPARPAPGQSSSALQTVTGPSYVDVFVAQTPANGAP